MQLLPAKFQKTPTCIKEIQVQKSCTKVYFQKELTAITQTHTIIIIINIIYTDLNTNKYTVLHLQFKHFYCDSAERNTIAAEVGLSKVLFS